MLAVAAASCASTAPRSPALEFPPSFSVSRDGTLRYRVPAGWFDATADTQAVGLAVWLMRTDYAASLSLEEIRADRQARLALQRGGLLELAQITLPLITRNRNAVLQGAPRLEEVDGRTICRYELLAAGTGETMLIALLDTSERIYALTLLTRDGSAGLSGGDRLALQEAFLANLRW